MDRIKTQEDYVSVNKEVLDKLIEMSFSDLKAMKIIHKKREKEIKEDIDFKVWSDGLDQIDKIEIRKYSDKSFAQIYL